MLEYDNYETYSEELDLDPIAPNQAPSVVIRNVQLKPIQIPIYFFECPHTTLLLNDKPERIPTESCGKRRGSLKEYSVLPLKVRPGQHTLYVWSRKAISTRN